MTNRIKRTSILNPSIDNTILMHERSLRRRNHLIILRSDDSNLILRLDNRLPIIQPQHSSTTRTKIITSTTAKEIKDIPNSLARGIT